MIDADTMDEYDCTWTQIRKKYGLGKEPLKPIDFASSPLYKAMNDKDRRTVDDLIAIQDLIDMAVEKIGLLRNSHLKKFYATGREWQTGGGCTGLVWANNEYYVMLTEIAGAKSPAPEDTHVCVGLYVNEETNKWPEFDLGLGVNCLWFGEVSVTNIEKFVDTLLQDAQLSSSGAIVWQRIHAAKH